MSMTLLNVLAQTATGTIEQSSPIVIYIASIIGALAVYFAMPKRRFNWPFIAAALGLAAIAILWGYLVRFITWENLGISNAAYVYYYVFSAISILSAVKVITHRKPVYSALWFVLVILSSAGLLITLTAQFMAFAMIIIYGGAILVTYMFVIMLASHSGDPEHEDEGTIYDKQAREPLLAIIASFLLMAALLNVWFTPANSQTHVSPIFATNAAAPADDVLINKFLANRNESSIAEAIIATEGEDNLKNYKNADTQSLTNIEKVGLNLFNSHPLALEIAGVILLISLIGAIVIAKTIVPEEQHLKS
ncbi:NADH-quinone oxidoreductase subunit J [Poriferisphaera corsica]|uniref:NADH-quinone oxidoreductase subunit J n=1 Tax=Poriferisphaera corsica TaxID=2528020 RepID=A0A517YV75_9BACT|nr:NADH-quinone oxidoreductase subunit J [Poriferisphaera corsica]QDU34124.1 NADH-quinone oxidoreductase subunit J [Poriferisphaera corsica]